MNKEEFLEILEDQLAGQMDGREIASNLEYYSGYIENCVRQGRSEEDVLAELGDPRLIARTLLDVEEQGGPGTPYEGIVYEESGDEFSPEDSGDDSQNPYAQDEGYVKRRSYHLDLSTWYGKAAVIVIAGLVIAGLVLLVGLMIPVILAVVGIGLVVYLLTHFFRR